MSDVAGQRERLLFLADVVLREAAYLAQTDARLFGVPFGLAEVARLPTDPDLAERVDAFVARFARFARLQDTLGASLLPHLLQAELEPVGSVLDNLNRAERLGWIRSASDWAEIRQLRNRMVHEYVRDPAVLVEALQAAHRAVPDLAEAASRMSALVQGPLRSLHGN